MKPDSPILETDLSQIENMLRTEAPFCTSFPDEDNYSVALYQQQSAMYGADIRMLVDRNVFGRVVSLARGAPVTQDDRLSAAIMVFAQFANLKLEPNLALYEGVATQNQNRAAHDLAIFRAIDNLHPSELAEIALGRSSKLRRPVVPRTDIPDLTALTNRLREYSFIYPFALKIGILELEGGRMDQRMRRFLDWSFDDWFFSAPATTLAAMSFSGAPPRDILKTLRDADRSLALNGLRNCAWDLTYVVHWGELLKRQESANALYVLCSYDKVLRAVAQRLVVNPSLPEEEIEKTLQETLGAAVFSRYADLIARKDDPARPANRAGLQRTEQITAALERQIQTWAPGS